MSVVCVGCVDGVVGAESEDVLDEPPPQDAIKQKIISTKNNERQLRTDRLDDDFCFKTAINLHIY